MIKMILASTEDGGIGLDNKLPWYCPEDLEYFKKTTSNSNVIMGRKTFDSLPFEDGLPNRYSYIITSGEDVDEENYQTVDFETLIGCLFGKHWEDENYWIIGGKSIYDQLLPFVDEIHHSVISGEYECDTFMDVTQWTKSSDWKLKETKVLSDKIKVYIWRKV